MCVTNILWKLYVNSLGVSKIELVLNLGRWTFTDVDTHVYILHMIILFLTHDHRNNKHIPWSKIHAVIYAIYQICILDNFRPQSKTTGNRGPAGPMHKEWFVVFLLWFTQVFVGARSQFNRFTSLYTYKLNSANHILIRKQNHSRAICNNSSYYITLKHTRRTHENHENT